MKAPAVELGKNTSQGMNKREEEPYWFFILTNYNVPHTYAYIDIYITLTEKL